MYEKEELKAEELRILLEKREKLINQINEIDQKIEDQTGRSTCEVSEVFEARWSERHAPCELPPAPH